MASLKVFCEFTQLVLEKKLFQIWMDKSSVSCSLEAINILVGQKGISKNKG